MKDSQGAGPHGNGHSPSSSAPLGLIKGAGLLPLALPSWGQRGRLRAELHAAAVPAHLAGPLAQAPTPLKAPLGTVAARTRAQHMAHSAPQTRTLCCQVQGGHCEPGCVLVEAQQDLSEAWASGTHTLGVGPVRAWGHQRPWLCSSMSNPHPAPGSQHTGCPSGHSTPRR